MALLDFLSKSYFKDKRALRDAEQYNSLLGSPQEIQSTSYGMNPDGSQGQGINNMGGGSGLLGGQMTRPQFNAQIGGIPAYRDMSTNLQMQGMRGNQAMDRQLQDQQYYGNNMTAYQQGMLNNDASRLRQQNLLAIAQREGVQFNRVEALQTKWDKEVEQYEPVVQAAQSFDDIVSNAGDYESLAGSDQLLGLIKFMKTATGGEAFMGDDMMNLAKSSGFTGMKNDLWTWVTTAGFKDPDVIRKMHKTMQQQATLYQGKIDEQIGNLRKAFPNMTSQTESQITRGRNTPYVQPTSDSWNEVN